MAPRTRTYTHLLLWLFTGTRGGPNRARIIEILRENPMNTNQLRITLELDYRTVKHHLEVLQDNDIIYSMGSGYGSMYFLTDKMEEHIEDFHGIWNSIKNKLQEKEEQ